MPHFLKYILHETISWRQEMKKAAIMLILIIAVTSAAAAASYNIDANEDVNLSGIDKIIFELKHPACAICVSTAKHTYSFNGGGSGGELSLSLEGDFKSNNRKAVPSLYTDESGGTLTVTLYKERSLFFGLVQSGSVHFTAELPPYFDGEIEILTSSGDTSVYNINSKSFSLQSSSGDIAVKSIEAGNVQIKASSGKTEAEKISAVERIYVHSSSGDMELDEFLSENIDIDANSGRIETGRIRAAEELTIKASSGRIISEYLEGGSISLHSSSGRISVNELAAERTQIDASSGDITIERMSGGAAGIEASSGKIDLGIQELSDDISIKSSSGDVNISLPRGTAFDVELDASSGKIRSDFKILSEFNNKKKNELSGEINGGGPAVSVKVSSGDINFIED